MNLILLAGNSPENEEWIEVVEAELGELFDITYIQRYKHWGAGGMIDLEKELEILEKEAESLEPYGVFAKSAGVLLALKGMAEKKLKPEMNVFCGTPREFGKKLGVKVDKWVSKLKTTSLFIQKNRDPAMHFEKLRDYLKEMGARNYELVKMEGSNHDYGDVEKLKELVISFIGE